MKIDNSKTKLFEVMSKLDKTFKPNLNEELSNKFHIPDKIAFDYSKGEYFSDKLEEIFKQMIQSDYGYDDILEIVQNILQKQP